MERVVIYGVGSPIVVDVQESLARAGITIAAAVRNMDCEVRLLDGVTPVESAELTAELLAFPFLVPFFRPANRQKVVREAFGAGFRSGYSLIDPTVPRSRVSGARLRSVCECGMHAGRRKPVWRVGLYQPGSEHRSPRPLRRLCLHWAWGGLERVGDTGPRLRSRSRSGSAARVDHRQQFRRGRRFGGNQGRPG